MNDKKNTGKKIGRICAVRGQVANVKLAGGYVPAVGEVLLSGKEAAVRLLVEECIDGTAECVNLGAPHELARNDPVVATGDLFKVPASKAIFGRVFNALGEPLDGGRPLENLALHSTALPARQELGSVNKPEILETGIKVIDFMAPFVKGRRIGIIGGAGVGKTVLTTEMMHNVADKQAALNFFVGIGERVREGHELYHTLKNRGLTDKTVMYLGQMSEDAVKRSMVGPTAATVARVYAEKGNDILFFIDNIYRFVQARNELAAMRAAVPSEGGYQPSLFSDLHRFEDSLQATHNGSITSVQSIFIPADDLSDPAVVEISQQLDSTIVLSRDVFEQGIFPAVDLLNTTSSLITSEILGKRHYNLVKKVKAVMRKYYSLKTITAIVGESELSPEDRLDYERAQELTQFFSQHMFVTEDLSGNPGEYFTRNETLKGVEAIFETKNEAPYGQS